MSDFVELGNGPAPMRVTLVDGRDNALSLERRDDTGPVAWPSAPVLRLRDAAGVVVFDAAGVLSNSDSVASWTVSDAVVSKSIEICGSSACLPSNRYARTSSSHACSALSNSSLPSYRDWETEEKIGRAHV